MSWWLSELNSASSELAQLPLVNHPGAIFPGVSGGIALILSLYSFSVLSVNAVEALVDQILSTDSRRTLSERGSVEEVLPEPLEGPHRIRPFPSSGSGPSSSSSPPDRSCQ